MVTVNTREHLELLIVAAQDLGWTRNESNKRGAVVLHAPTPFTNISIHVPAGRQIRDNLLTAWARKIIRYADREKLVLFEARGKRLGLLDDSKDQAFMHSIARSVAPLPDPLPERKTKRTTATDVEHVQLPKEATRNEEARGSDPVKDHDEGTTLPHTVVSERPWLAHRGYGSTSGRRYNSATTIERTWSDGHVDYACAWPGCEYTKDNPHSVASHYAHRRDHEPVPGDREKQFIRDPEYIQPATDRRRLRVASLAERIARAMVGLDPSADDFAERLADRMVPEGNGGDGEVVPLTADEVIERIRALVDQGEYLVARRRAIELEEQVGKLSHELAVAVETSKRATERWTALRELIDQEPA